MTREEEIKQAAKNRADQYEHPVDWNNCYHHYIQGAEWADQHPRKGLWDSQKVLDWVKKTFSETDKRFNKNYSDMLIKCLCKAMEE